MASRAGVILGDKTEKEEYGGGLCQVSSTMFRAALFSGLPIPARKNHSYWVMAYGAPFWSGLMQLYDPKPNLKFVNDTPGDILIELPMEQMPTLCFIKPRISAIVQMEGLTTVTTLFLSCPLLFVDHFWRTQSWIKHVTSGFQTDWYAPFSCRWNQKYERENIPSNYEVLDKNILRDEQMKKLPPSV